MKFWWKLSIALLALFVVTPAFAQKWTMPGKGTAVPCTGCPAPATGKLTYPFDSPLVRHVGRYVDSSSTGNVQNAGMRTVRARVIRTYPERNRVVIALGETVGVYKLESFFTSKFNSGLVPVNSINMGTTNPWGGRGGVYEKFLMPDRYFYAESIDSNWYTYFQDSQRQLNDFDLDDRGYLYVATITFGWGLARDNGTDGGDSLDYVTQVTTGATADFIFSLKLGPSEYYAVISSATRGGEVTQVYDVSNPQVISVPRDQPSGRWVPPLQVSRPRTGSDRTYGIKAWAKYDEGKRLAVVHTDDHLRIYDYETFVSTAASPTPLADHTPAAGKTFAALSFDETGRLWVAESAKSLGANVLWKLSPAGNGYTKETFDVYGQNFSPSKIHAAGGYVALIGLTADYYDVFLMKVEGGTPRLLDTDGFFRKYYSRGPANHVALDFQSPSTYENGGVHIFEQGNKTYLFYSAGGLGDVYEVEGGESISITQVPGPYGTANPNAKSTEEGPFYGDILKFKATSNNASANYTIDWDFGNPDSGNENSAQSGLNQNVTHQFTGLNTASEVTTVKKVKASVSTDASIADELNVTLKLPKARITVPGFTSPMTQEDKQTFEVVAGDTFKDASDGVVEGHYAAWSIDGVTTKALPNSTVDVGVLGTHTLALSANYGKYNATTFTGTGAYTAVVSNISYGVKPFIARIKPPVSSATDYTFGAEARVTPLNEILSATQWTVTWTVQGPSSANGVSASEVSTVPVGTVPNFVIPKSSVHDGDIVKLQISVDATAVPAPAYATYTTTQTLSIPEIGIQKTGCANAGDPCTLTAVSLGGGSTSLWQIQWTIKRGATTVKTGTGLSITFTPTEAGSYVATAKETAYNVSADLPFTVAPTTCGPVPEEHNVEITASCGNNCGVNEAITFEPSIFGYSVQPCDTFSWTFGDGGTATGRVVEHTYARNGPTTVRLTIKNNNPVSNTRTWQKTINIGGGGEQCSLPVAINITYSGPGGCGAGTPCKVGDSVRFTAMRGGTPLLNCDATSWTIDDQPPISTKSPSVTFTTSGLHTVKVVVSNQFGSSGEVSTNVTINPGSSNCTGFATELNLGVEYSGAQSGCSSGSPTTPCRVNEVITFTPTVFGYSFQACDRYEWNFGDNTTSTAKSPTKTYTTQQNSYRVTLKVYNTNNPGGVTVPINVPFANVPVKPAPKLTYQGFPTAGTKGVPVTFTVTSDISATGWIWDFNDGTIDTTQSSVVGTSTSIAHTFTGTGTYSVKVTARNSEDTAGAPTNFAIGTITISETPEYRYLLPVVTHGPGQNNSVWRTDVQVYNPDPSVSSNNPLVMKAKLRNLETTLNVTTSTYIYEDFMQRLTSGNDSGPVVITTRTKFAPQIWTRTYNATDQGTFGQFIPAIRLDNVGSGGAIGEGMYYLAGLRHDDRYRTNLGFVNPGLQTINATIRVYDEERRPIAQFVKTLPPFELVQFPIKSAGAVPDLPSDRAFSIEIEVPAGQWVVAYASYIDGVSNDPVFIQAMRDGDLASEDYAKNVIPGVGHTGQWRSDVTIFNPDDRNGVNFDLTYYDQSGAKVAEAKNIFLGPLKFLQYNDLLKQGVLGNVADGLGVLRVTANAATIPNNRYPMTFARTYFDDGGRGTYGQGINGFATARANVRVNKPALVPAVRSDANYYTNVGLTNLTDAQVAVTVTLLNPQTGAAGKQQQYILAPNQSVIGTFDFAGLEQGSLKIDTNAGSVWAFCSVIDRRTKDPEYVSATPLVP